MEVHGELDSNSDTHSDIAGADKRPPAYPVNSYVAATYDGQWYTGKIIEYDPEDTEYNISFMSPGNNKHCQTFRWPVKVDRIWAPASSILCPVSEPVPHGKTRKVFKPAQIDIDTILQLHRE